MSFSIYITELSSRPSLTDLPHVAQKHASEGNETEAKEYKKYLKELRYIASEQHTKMANSQDLINQGISKEEENKEIETVLKLKSKGKSNQEIADLVDYNSKL